MLTLLFVFKAPALSNLGGRLLEMGEQVIVHCPDVPV